MGGRPKGEGIHIQLIHFTVQQKQCNSAKQLYSNLRKEKEKRKLVGAPKNYFTACYITQGLKDTSELFVFPQVSQVNT